MTMTEPAQVPPAAPVSVTPQHFLDLLVRDGKLSEEQVNQLRSEQLITGKSLETLLAEKKTVNEPDVTKAKAAFSNIPLVRVSEMSASPEALNLVGERVSRRYKVLPYLYDKENRTLKVAMSDPLDLSAVNFLKQKTGLTLEIAAAVPSELEKALTEQFSQNLSSEVTQALEQNDLRAEKIVKADTPSRAEVVRDAPINRIVETVLDFAVKARASDIHIEPQIGKTKFRYL